MHDAACSPARDVTASLRGDAAPDAASRAVLPVRGEGLVVERGGRRILDAVDIAFEGPGISAVLGPNGAGKSVLLRVLAGVVAADAGRVTWAGHPPRRDLRPRLGFVFQKPVLLRRSALANVRYALHAAGVARGASLERARDALAFAGLAHLERSPARLLSGGEQQRLALARAVATQPEVLFLDEPTANLDPASTARIEALVREIAGEGRKVVLVSHDVGQVRRLAADVAFVHHGRVVEHGPAARFIDNPGSDAARAFLDGRIVL